MIKQVASLYGGTPVLHRSVGIIDSGNLVTVSVADKKIANQEALRLFVHTLKRHSPNIMNDFVFLYPRGEIGGAFVREIRSLGVRPIDYALDRQGDPYRTKFLLCSFLREWHEPKDYCLYIDPDHLALGQLRLTCPDKGILLSSETKDLADLNPPPNLGGELGDTHFNNSIILGHVDTWKEVIGRWEETYRCLAGIIPTRFLEEVAFSLAAKQVNVATAPSDSTFQSSFAFFDETCSLFHYGGDSHVAIETKKILASKRDITGNLITLRQGASTYPERWFLDAIINALPAGKDEPCSDT